MRRNARNSQNDDMGNKIIKYASIGVVVLTVIVIGLLIYSQSLTEDVRESTLNKEQLASLMNRASENEVQEEGTETTSTEMGRTVEEAKNELENSNTTNQTSDRTSQSNATNTTNTTNASKSTNTTKTTNSPNTSKTITTDTNQTNANKTENTVTNSTKETKTEKKETVQELKFVKPVEGEIVKEYAKENLLFSETLQEWTVHTGIDIQADKTTVVKAAEAGTIKNIKNDPRYGLTIVVEHANGFQTVYANLLTSEFVVEGEKVEKEQSLGTVGNTAAFESADEPHLHFEVLKDNESVDPTIYLK